MSSTRRIYLYLITLLTIGIFAAGIVQLLSLLFNVSLRDSLMTQVTGESFDIQQLSLGLSMTLIAGPLWFFFWRSIQKRITGNIDEIGAAPRKLYLNLIIFITALAGLNSASSFLVWLMDGIQLVYLPSVEISVFMVSVGIWIYHWQISEKEGHPSSTAKTLRRWYVYFLAGFALFRLSTGLIMFINAAILSLPVWKDTLTGEPFWSNMTIQAITWLLLGGCTWYFHWFYAAKGDTESVLRQVYFYLLAIPGGAIAALVALTTTIYQVLSWSFSINEVSAGQHFQFLGWSLPTILIGITIWSFHRQLAQEEQAYVKERQLSAQRIHLYLMSFLGLGTMVAGLIYLVGILLELIIGTTTPAIAGSPDGWKEALSYCLALIITGTPLWLYYWSKVLKIAESGGVTEWRARSRRIFLYVVVGIAIGVLIASLVNIVYQLLNGLLQGDFGTQVIRNIRWSLQSLVIAVPLLWYHWRIIRTDQRRGAEAAAVQKTITVLARESTAVFIIKLIEQIGYKTQVLYRTDKEDENVPAISNEEITKAIDTVQKTPGDNLLLVALDEKIMVFPYQKK